MSDDIDLNDQVSDSDEEYDLDMLGEVKQSDMFGAH